MTKANRVMSVSAIKTMMQPPNVVVSMVVRVDGLFFQLVSEGLSPSDAKKLSATIRKAVRS